LWVIGGLSQHHRREMKRQKDDIRIIEEEFEVDNFEERMNSACEIIAQMLYDNFMREKKESSVQEGE